MCYLSILKCKRNMFSCFKGTTSRYKFVRWHFTNSLEVTIFFDLRARLLDTNLFVGTSQIHSK